MSGVSSFWCHHAAWGSAADIGVNHSNHGVADSHSRGHLIANLPLWSKVRIIHCAPLGTSARGIIALRGSYVL